MSLAYQGKYAEAEDILQAALVARRRVLGSAHPHTLATAGFYEKVRSLMRAKQPTKKGAKAAARKERAAAAPLSPTALAEAEAEAGAAEAEAELQAICKLEGPEVGSVGASISAKGEDKASKR
jgi:hypothetical protein